MWTIDDEMQTFKALSYLDKVRVSRHLTRGQAPADPLLATAAVELAESYQGPGRLLAAMRWFLVFSVLFFALAAAFAAVEGDQRGLVFYGLLFVGNLSQFALNPVTRPRNRTRALEASKRIAASGP